MICFQNDGLIDLRTITTFGVSSKETENPIGFFGTGLKYAIAICLRHHCKVVLYRGLEKFEFSMRTERIRVNDFSIVYMNDQPLSFTTELGKSWEMWQAFRELYCNAIDEHEAKVGTDIEPCVGKTTITVEGLPMEHAYNNRDDIILSGTPDFVEHGVEVYNRPSPYIYYRGIRVQALEDSSFMTYNIVGHKIRLTEDRTVMSAWEPALYIIRMLLKSNHKDFVHKFLTAPINCLESKIGIADSSCGPERTFLEAFEELNFRDVTNHSAITLYKKFSGKLYLPDEEPLNPVEEKQLAKAKAFLLKAFDIDLSDQVIYITSDLPAGTLAMLYEGRIFIGRQCFRQGTKLVAWALLEEWMHKTTGFSDCSRELQSHLFERLLSLGEQILGEPV